MYAGDGNMFGSPWQELHHLDRVLSQLTKPAIEGSHLPPSLHDQLRALGLELRPSARREELIAKVWGRKRPLLRRLDTFDDTPPACA